MAPHQDGSSTQCLRLTVSELDKPNLIPPLPILTSEQQADYAEQCYDSMTGRLVRARTIGWCS